MPANEDAQLLDNTQGRCAVAELGLNLRIHANDTVKRQTVHEQFTNPPKVTASLTLEGGLDSALDDHPLRGQLATDLFYLWINRQPAYPDRWTRTAQGIRKIKNNEGQSKKAFPAAGLQRACRFRFTRATKSVTKRRWVHFVSATDADDRPIACRQSRICSVETPIRPSESDRKYRLG